MRDGVLLATDVYLPPGFRDVPLPTILVRTPYCKDAVTFNIEPIVSEGYVLVIQDCRGRFSSEGDYEPNIVDAQTGIGGGTNDGADTVDWVLAQGWCNGRVGMFGASGFGAPIWHAVMSGASITTGIPLITGSVFGGFGFYTAGVPQLDVMLLWNAGMGKAASADNELARFLGSGEGQQEILLKLFAQRDLETGEGRRLWEQAQAVLGNHRRRANDLFALPLHEAARQVMDLSPWVERWIANASPASDYWQGCEWPRRYDDIQKPLLHVVGWNDMFLRGTLDSFAALTSRENAPFQKIVITPASHLTCIVHSAGFPVGEKKFPRTPFYVESWFDIETAPRFQGGLFSRWMRHWLKGEDTGLLEEPPITLFVMGENVWRDEWEWPLARTQWTPLYLRSGGRANSVSGDGVLDFDDPSEKEPCDRFRYDPANPVPSRGGTFLGMANEAGMLSQNDIETRDDVLVYTSGKLDSAMEVTGPVKVVLWVSTSGVDTDFTAKLVDVGPDGLSYNICDGVCRLRYQEELNGRDLTEPFEITMDLTPTSYLFMAGHRIRLQVSSSNFPLIDINPNTGKSLLLDELNEMRVAEQTVFHDRDRASHIALPVIPRD